MDLKRQDDYDILRRVEEGINKLNIDMTETKIKVSSLEKVISVNNGTKCVLTRLTKAEENILSLQGADAKQAWQNDWWVTVLILLGAVPGLVLTIIQIGKTMKWWS